MQVGVIGFCYTFLWRYITRLLLIQARRVRIAERMTALEKLLPQSVEVMIFICENMHAIALMYYYSLEEGFLNDLY